MTFWGRRESEIEFLRAQLAHHQRRIDELESRLLNIVDPLAKAAKPAEPRKRHRAKPRGWEAYRAEQRKQDETERIPQELNAWREAEAEDEGA